MSHNPSSAPLSNVASPSTAGLAISEELKSPSSPLHGPQFYQRSPSRPTSSSGDPFKSREGSPRQGQYHFADSLKEGPPSVSTHRPPSPLTEKADVYHSEIHSAPALNRRSTAFELPEEPLPPLPTARMTSEQRPISAVRRQPTSDTRMTRRSNLDWIVPVEEDEELREKARGRTYGERLAPTLTNAETERAKYAQKAKITGWTLNAAIGLQVLLGSLTTGLSAVATSGRSAAVQTTILGGLSTIVASYLARARGSNEPELSITRTKDLEQFIRECKAFDMDYGHLTGNEHDERLQSFRRRFEELLGNANGERKLAPPV